jgi:methionyl-tRNA formyltransferase
MKIVILTTETLHHAYFVKGVAEAFAVETVFVETGALHPPFETHHPFEDLRDEYETIKWFNGRQKQVAEFAEIRTVASVNEPEAISALNRIKPDVVLVFGTGKLRPAVIATCPAGMLNLHGGDPEHYRGLDSHMWAVYHNDFSRLVTTLHRVNPILDDGDILLQTSLKLFRGMDIHMVRLVNTEACLKMSLAALDMYVRFGTFITKKQQNNGRYYSFMPAALKEICRKKFAKFTGAL